MLKKAKIAVVNMNGTPDFDSHYFFSNIKDYY